MSNTLDAPGYYGFVLNSLDKEEDRVELTLEYFGNTLTYDGSSPLLLATCIKTLEEFEIFREEAPLFIQNMLDVNKCITNL